MYSQWFSSAANTTNSFKDKIKLYTLICCLTQALKKKDPLKFGDPLKVLSYIYQKDFLNEPETSFGNYIIALSIICDDLLYGVTEEIERPNKETGTQLVEEIKRLINQWLPF